MKPIQITAAILVIVVALVCGWRAMHTQPPNDVTMPYIGLGQVLAEQAAEVLLGKEGRVVVVCMPTATAGSQAQLEGLRRALGQQRNMKITMDAFKAGDVGPMDTISFQQFATVVSANANADVIISFLRVAPFTDAQIAQLPHPAPKLIVVRWEPAAVQRGMSAGLVAAAVMARRWNESSAQPKDPRQWFDGRYQLVTPGSGMPPE